MTRFKGLTEYTRLSASSLGGDHEAGAEELFQFGMTSYREGNLDLAERALRRASRLAPERPDLHSSLGIVLYDRAKFDDAVTAFHSALQLNPSEKDALLGLGATLHVLGGVSDAIFYYLSYLRLEPESVTAMQNLGIAFASMGQFDEAIQQFENAARLQPDNPEVYASYGRAFYDAGRLDDAVPQLQVALQKGAIDIDVYRCLALALIAKNDLVAARTVLEDAVLQHPQDVAARIDLSALLLDFAEPEKAVEHAERAAELADSEKDSTLRAHSYWQLGWALYQAGRWRESVAASKTAIDLDESLVAPRFNLGVALYRAGDVVEAQAQYEKALEATDDPLDLRTLGIRDLKAALAEVPDKGGDVILARLEARYDELVDGRRSSLPVIG